MAKAATGQLKGRDVARLREGIARAPLERQQAWAKALDGFTPLDLEIAKALLPLRLQKMEEVLAGSDWLAGPAYSLADIVVFPTAAATAGPDARPGQRHGGAGDHGLGLDRMKARPAVQAALAAGPHPRPRSRLRPRPRREQGLLALRAADTIDPVDRLWRRTPVRGRR